MGKWWRKNKFKTILFTILIWYANVFSQRVKQLFHFGLIQMLILFDVIVKTIVYDTIAGDAARYYVVGYFFDKLKIL